MTVAADLPPHVASLGHGVRVELPQLRAPIALLVDDPMPRLNPLYYHRKFFDGAARPRTRTGVPLVRTMRPGFLDRFCDIVRGAGAKGKFSVVPNPFGLGEIDRGFRECPRRDCRAFIETVRARLMPAFDITPEMLTHGHALDLDTGRRLAENEDAWSRQQGVEPLTRYLTHAAAILQRAGLEPNGFTSPWAFGRGVEGAYAQAALRAQQSVNGRALTWFFLDASERRRVMPRMMVLRRARREAVVHIVVGAPDYLWDTQNTMHTAEPYLREREDLFITASGQGRVAALVKSGSFVCLLTHWQSLYSNGTEAGIVVLRRVLRRINRLFGRRVTWMKCSEMARYFAAAKAARARPVGRAVGSGTARGVADGIMITSPFACSEFTISLPAAQSPAGLTVGGSRLTRVPSPVALCSGAWAWSDGRTYLCFDLGETALVMAQRPR
jgi:hypothetical protein